MDSGTSFQVKLSYQTCITQFHFSWSQFYVINIQPLRVKLSLLAKKTFYIVILLEFLFCEFEVCKTYNNMAGTFKESIKVKNFSL